MGSEMAERPRRDAPNGTGGERIIGVIGGQVTAGRPAWEAGGAPPAEAAERGGDLRPFACAVAAWTRHSLA